MPALTWVGKEKIVNHHHDVPFRILDKQYSFTANEGAPTNSLSNRIIHGDNLESLKSLLPEFEGKVNCIYIDPPYNTGNEGWVYNDNVNDPKIKKWLGLVVGKEGDDLSRHDKWLCMMYPRLKLLHRLLAIDGVIFISIDDNEYASLKLLCDEIFGYKNCVGSIIQNKMNAKNDSLNIQKNHEFILVYGKVGDAEKTLLLSDKTSIEKKVVKENGKYFFINDSITTRGDGGTLESRPNLGYTIYYHPKTKDKVAVSDYDLSLAKISNKESEVYSSDSSLIAQGYIPIRPPKVRKTLGAWTWDIEKFKAENENIVITGNVNRYSVKKRTFVDEKDVYIKNDTYFYNSNKPKNSRSILDFSTNDGTNVLNEIMNKSKAFDNPKNLEMLEYLLHLTQGKDSIVLDSFAGSGTTAHAILNLNKRDGGNRRFILCEMMDYAETITAERVRRVINGYGEGKKATSGTGGGFDYYTVGPELFNDDKNLNEDVGELAIRNYVSYTENIPTEKQCDQDNLISHYALGLSATVLWIFYYERNQITSLNLDFLASLNLNPLLDQGGKRPEQYIIYADKCALDKDFLYKHGITFKRIPRDITRF